jgi:hypothetical protein
VLALASVALCCAVGGGRALDAESAAPHSPPTTAGPPPSPAVATALQYSNAMHADVDGDGCDDELSYSEGVLAAGPVRMRIGAPSDEVALGRWTCGPVTVALLRPPTGEVFRFDGWATQDRSIPAVALGRVEGAVALNAARRPDGRCDDLVVVRGVGAPVLLPERPVAG